MTSFGKVCVCEVLGTWGRIVADPEHCQEGRVRGIFVKDGGDKVGVGGGDGQREIRTGLCVGGGHDERRRRERGRLEGNKHFKLTRSICLFRRVYPSPPPMGKFGAAGDGPKIRPQNWRFPSPKIILSKLKLSQDGSTRRCENSIAVSPSAYTPNH